MCNIKKVMISLDESVLSDIDSISDRMGLSRSAFIRFLFYHYNESLNIIAGHEIEKYLLQQELSRFKDIN